MHGWECLPPPCLMHVLHHATPADRRACRLVCRLWHPVASAAMSSVHLPLPLAATPPAAAAAALDRALRPFPRATGVHLTLTGTAPATPLAALLTSLAASPALAPIRHLTLTAPALTTALPLLPLRPLTQLRTLTLNAPHSPHLLAHLAPCLPHLTALQLDPAHLTTPPTNHTIAHLIPPLAPTLASLSLPLSTATSDPTLLALRPLTRLTRLTLTGGRHFVSPAALAALTPLVHLHHFSASHLVFHSIASALALHPHRMHPHYAPPPTTSPTAAHTWPAAFKAVLSAWTHIETLHVCETDLDPLVVAALPFAPPSLRSLTLDLRYTSQCLPPTAQQAAPLAACPSLHLVLEPHRDHALADYQPLLAACPNLHSLSLLGITLDVAPLCTLHSAPALRHLSLHFLSAAPHPHGPALLSAALLAPLASMSRLSTLHVSAPRHLAPSLAHLLHDSALPELLADLPLHSLSIATLSLAGARAAAATAAGTGAQPHTQAPAATCSSVGAAATPAPAEPPAQAESGTCTSPPSHTTPATCAATSPLPVAIHAACQELAAGCPTAGAKPLAERLPSALADSCSVARPAATTQLPASTHSAANVKGAAAAAAAAAEVAGADGAGAAEGARSALASWAAGAAAVVQQGLDGLVRAGRVQRVAVQLPDLQLHWAAAG